MAEPRFLLDANSCIYLIEKLSQSVRERAGMCQPGEMVTSAIVFAEVARGTDWNNVEAAGLVTDFFAAVPVLAFDQHAARVYADLAFKRHRFDRLIGAHALALRLTVVTSNVADYADIQGLSLEDWTR